MADWGGRASGQGALGSWAVCTTQEGLPTAWRDAGVLVSPWCLGSRGGPADADFLSHILAGCPHSSLVLVEELLSAGSLNMRGHLPFHLCSH